MVQVMFLSSHSALNDVRAISYLLTTKYSLNSAIINYYCILSSVYLFGLLIFIWKIGVDVKYEQEQEIMLLVIILIYGFID